MAEEPQTIDEEFLRTWIGREELATDVVSTDLGRKFSATFGHQDSPSEGKLAPRLIHFCLTPPVIATNLLGEDGHPRKGGFLPPVPLPRRMWAGSRLVFHGDLRVGDVVSRVSRIVDVAVKEGRSGTLCFVTVEHKIDVAGVLRIEEIQNIVYRQAAGSRDGDPSTSSEVKASGIYSQPVSVSIPLLFRYSALTFNGHRIHYDRRYATEVEQYPGLVVHGPLQATLLLNYATELRGISPAQFRFRGVSPLFDHDKIQLHASEEGEGMKLWTARENGQVGMSAEAVW